MILTLGGKLGGKFGGKLGVNLVILPLPKTTKKAVSFGPKTYLYCPDNPV